MKRNEYKGGGALFAFLALLLWPLALFIWVDLPDSITNTVYALFWLTVAIYTVKYIYKPKRKHNGLG